MNPLKAARKAAGLTQVEVAEYIGISQPQYSAWENGRSKIDNVSLSRLATLLNVTADYLLGKEAKEMPIPAAEDGQERNIIRIVGRDGSVRECIVSDGQRELFKQMLDNLKPVDDESI